MATILVVDDRPVNRQFLVTLLGYSGHRLLEAADGIEALAVAQSERPDLAIVDIVMPAMDGYAFVRQIRADPELSQMPVVFYTATYLESAARRLADSVGVSYVLTKPADPAVVLATVDEALGMVRTVPPAAPGPALESPPDDPLRLLNASLSNKLDEVIPRLTALVQAGLEFSVERDLDRLIERVGDAARSVSQARCVVVGLVQEEQPQRARLFTTCEANTRASGEVVELPCDEGLFHTLLAERRPVRLPGLEGHPEAAFLPRDPGGGRAILGVPFVSANHLFGFVYLTGRMDPGEFTEQDEQLVRTLVAQAATRYENAKLYQELQGHTTQLQLQMAERARLEAELQRRLDELAQGDRRKDEFLAMLSHELRNPLAAISSAGTLLDNTLADDEPTAQARSVIRRQTGNLAHMVNDLLDASRITSGKIELVKGLVSVDAVVQQAVAATRPLVESRGHALSVSLPAEPLCLDADATRLEQVVTNLLNNAAKYTEPGGRIWLTGKRRGQQLELRVRDTGAGIAPDLLPRVFDLFAQGNRSLARSEGGLGVGLAVVRTLVELHGGTVEAHSDGPGKGSEFVVRLPLASAECEVASVSIEGGKPTVPSGELGEAAPDAAVPPKQPGMYAAPAETEALPSAVIPAAGPPSAHGAKRVLVVDDNADAAELLAALIEMDGYEVWVEHNGPAALASASEHRPDVILLDLGMPGMDGYEVATRLRREPSLAATVIVAITGYGHDEDRLRTREAGFDHHLVKPVDIGELRRLLMGAAAGDLAALTCAAR